jgi:hypothetical protein
VQHTFYQPAESPVGFASIIVLVRRGDSLGRPVARV